jgi:hypothetical protein
MKKGIHKFTIEDKEIKRVLGKAGFYRSSGWEKGKKSCFA